MKISIIVPVYNASQYLCECIESILSQSFRDFELILINDGSTDNSLSICKKLRKAGQQDQNHQRSKRRSKQGEK